MMTKPKALFLRSARLVQSHGGVRWLPTDLTCLRYGGISESTLRRRWQTIPEHPKPVKFSEYGANFFDESALDAYDAHAAELSARRRAERMAKRQAEADQAQLEESRIEVRRAKRRGGKRTAEMQS
jgi:hypothetical protein